jgi:hypothetical protein
MVLNFYNTTSLSAVGVWTPSQKLVVAGGVFDPNSQANNFATKAFDRVNLYGRNLVRDLGSFPPRVKSGAQRERQEAGWLIKRVANSGSGRRKKCSGSATR